MSLLSVVVAAIATRCQMGGQEFKVEPAGLAVPTADLSLKAVLTGYACSLEGPGVLANNHPLFILEDFTPEGARPVSCITGLPSCEEEEKEIVDRKAKRAWVRDPLHRRLKNLRAMVTVVAEGAGLLEVGKGPGPLKVKLIADKAGVVKLPPEDVALITESLKQSLSARGSKVFGNFGACGEVAAVAYSEVLAWQGMQLATKKSMDLSYIYDVKTEIPWPHPHSYDHKFIVLSPEPIPGVEGIKDHDSFMAIIPEALRGELRIVDPYSGEKYAFTEYKGPWVLRQHSGLYAHSIIFTPLANVMDLQRLNATTPRTVTVIADTIRQVAGIEALSPDAKEAEALMKEAKSAKPGKDVEIYTNAFGL